MFSHRLIRCEGSLHGVEHHRHYSKYDQYRAIEAREIVSMLFIKVQLAREQRGIEVEPHQPQLAEAVPF